MQYSITEIAPGQFEIRDEHSIYWHKGDRASAEAFIQSVHRRNAERGRMSDAELMALVAA
jgi:hypothetical protein